jgi:hypothetical protein
VELGPGCAIWLKVVPSVLRSTPTALALPGDPLHARLIVAAATAAVVVRPLGVPSPANAVDGTSDAASMAAISGTNRDARKGPLDREIRPRKPLITTTTSAAATKVRCVASSASCPLR